MILVDTSVWVDHFRQMEPMMVSLLRRGQVFTHPSVIGELAVGSFADRASTLADLRTLPQVQEVAHADVLAMIEAHQLYSRGVGYVDMQLLASALISNIEFWVRDQRSRVIAQQLGVASTLS